MSALLRGHLHKRQGLKLLVLSCCVFPSWALSLESALLLCQISVTDGLSPQPGQGCQTLSTVHLEAAPAGFGAGKSRKTSGKGFFPQQRNPHSRWVSKVNCIRNTPRFTSTSSGSHLRTVFPSCQQLFSSSTLLLVLGASTGNAGTSRTHRTRSHPLDSLFCTFFMRSEHRAAQASQTQILLPLGKREATTVRLRASDGLAAPSSSVCFIPVFIPHSNSQLPGVNFSH